DSGFTDIVESAAGLTATSFVPTRPLEFSTTYYWRVRAVNTCGAGSYSAVYSFTTQLYPPGSLVVDSTADAVDQNPGDGFCRTAGGECTLRAAVQEGNASSDETTTIVLPAGAYLLTIPGANEDAAATGDLDVTGNLLILGDSAPLAVIDGNGTVTGDRVFHVLAGGEATISGVTIRGGRANDGGGLYNSGTATLTAVTLTANTSTGTLFAGGGAIINKGTLLVTDSAIHNNTSGDRGAAIYNTPSTAQATVINSTLSSNAAGYGGALFDDGATLTLTGSTITLNTASHDGGGAYLQAGGTLRTGQTIWAGNSGGAPNCRTVTGSLLSDGYNILGNNSGCSFTSTTGDQIGTPSNPIDPRLGPLGDNGGPTFTHALSSGSPAIDTGDPTNCLPFDQRGEPRPQDGDGNGSAICDIGAYEAGPGQASLFCSSPNLAIPDNNPAGVNDYLTLSETGSITDLDVYLLASHTWVGDLLFTLEHVATGTTITLIDRPGAPPAPSCDGDDIDATLDDEAATLVEEACAPTTPTIFGSFIPYNSLSAFDGEDLSGGWRLTAADLSSGDTGTLTQWCLVVER
ncbi:MAG: choice-of-anchor Q domain-containing protein, partial [Chloroflexota bacterium]